MNNHSSRITLLAGLILLFSLTSQFSYGAVSVLSFSTQWDRRIGFDPDADNYAPDNEDTGIISDSSLGELYDDHTTGYGVAMNASVYGAVVGDNMTIGPTGYVSQVVARSMAEQTSGTNFPPGLYSGIYTVSTVTSITEFLLDSEYEISISGFLGKSLTTSSIQSFSSGGIQLLQFEQVGPSGNAVRY